MLFVHRNVNRYSASSDMAVMVSLRSASCARSGRGEALPWDSAMANHSVFFVAIVVVRISTWPRMLSRLSFPMYRSSCLLGTCPLDVPFCVPMDFPMISRMVTWIAHEKNLHCPMVFPWISYGCSLPLSALPIEASSQGIDGPANGGVETHLVHSYLDGPWD